VNSFVIVRAAALALLVGAAVRALAPDSAFAQTPDPRGGLVTSAASAQTSDPGAASDAVVSSSSEDSAAAAASTGTPPDYIAMVRANFTPENQGYSSKRVTLAFIEPIYGALAALLLLFSGVSARMRDFAGRVTGGARAPAAAPDAGSPGAPATPAAPAAGKGRYARVLVYLTLYTIASSALAFPLAYVHGFALEHQYHLSNQTFGAWFVDELKGLALGIVFLGVIPIVSLAYAAIARNPRRWWLWLAVGSFPVIVVGTLLGPLVFEPAFNKFTPLKDKVLEQKILDLAERAGIPSRKVLEANKSAQTKKFNAYVSGFGASQRIVLWDTILEGMEEDEILFVMGHEMGHYVLAHIWKGIVVTVIVCALFFYLSHLVTAWAIARFGRRWGFTELSDIASMPLIVATISLISFVAQPMTNSFSRYIEHEADTFGLEVTRLTDAGARAFIKLGSQNKSNPEPNPVVKAFMYTHPPLIERIRYAQEYRPWEEGRPNAKYRGRK